MKDSFDISDITEPAPESSASLAQPAAPAQMEVALTEITFLSGAVAENDTDLPPPSRRPTISMFPALRDAPASVRGEKRAA